MASAGVQKFWFPRLLQTADSRWKVQLAEGLRSSRTRTFASRHIVIVHIDVVVSIVKLQEIRTRLPPKAAHDWDVSIKQYDIYLRAAAQLLLSHGLPVL